MEIHQSAVILLLIFSVSSFTHGQPPAHIKPRYEKFLKQHYNPDMTVQKCDTVIRANRDFIHSETENGCKKINSFIQANSNDIKAVCGRAGKPYHNMVASTKPFSVVTCKLHSGDTHPNCKYRGVRDTRYIVLACEHGWPVHYDEGIYKPNGS
ncbi:ribonuclease-like 3 [Chanodichthys erythropterus]|uniref:ribonuclease-like 3 n=1 Tax=Chanodichthys erythropterus TaxID=933992 RepID=UPI00351F4A52